MSRVRYAKSLSDLERAAVAEAEYLDSTVRSVRCVYETDSELAQAIVPKPLEPATDPEICVSFSTVAMHLSPDLTLEIGSAYFGVRVAYNEVPGIYLVTMPMSSERAVVGGRETFGEPKKLAEIEFAVDGDHVRSSVARMDLTYLSFEGEKVEALGARESVDYGYCFKAFPSCEKAGGFDSDPQLVRLEWHRHDRAVWRLDGTLTLGDSPFDPVADLPIRRVVSMEYSEGTAQSNGRVLRPVPGDWLLPFLHQRYDDPSVEGRDV